MITYPAENRRGLIGHWKYHGNVSASGTWYDVSGNGNHGTLAGNAFVDNQGVNFDGNGDYVSTALTDSQHTIVNNGFAICGWAKWRSVSNEWWRAAFLGQSAGSGSAFNKWIFSYDHLSGALIFHINTPGVGAAEIKSVGWAGLPDLNKWLFVAVSKKSNVYSFFVQDIKYGDVSNSLQCGTIAAPVLIGTAEGGAIFNGYMDNLMFYNRDLSAAEISQIYHQTRGRY